MEHDFKGTFLEKFILPDLNSSEVASFLAMTG